MCKNTLLDLGRERFGGLSCAEERVLESVPRGEGANCLGCLAEGHSVDLSQPDSMPTELNIRSELITWLCCDVNPRRFITRHGLEVFGAQFVELLDLTRADIPFPVAFERCALREPLLLAHAKVESLSLRGAWTSSVIALGVEIRGDLDLGEGLHAQGGVRFDGARIGGSVTCTGSWFTGPATDPLTTTIHDVALSLGHTHVDGRVLLNDRFRAQGQVRLENARIERELTCTNGIFFNPMHTGMSLNCTGAWIGGDVFLTEGFFSWGECRFLSSHVEGDVRIMGSRLLAGRTERALVADRSRFMRSWVQESSVISGEVRAISAQVAFSVGFDDVEFVTRLSRFMEVVEERLPGSALVSGKHEEASCSPSEWPSEVNLQHSTIGTRLRWRGITVTPLTILNIAYASTETLSDDASSWPTHGNLVLDGLVYQRISSDAVDAGSRLEWLGRQKEYLPQPYEQLAKVLRAEGREKDAEIVAMAKQERRRMSSGLGYWSRVGSFILKYAIGYGYRPQRALAWGVLVAVVGGVLFHVNASLMAPTGSPGPHSLSPFAYSLDTFLPIVDFGQAKAWAPDPCRGDEIIAGLKTGGLLRFYTWIHISLGWVLSTLAVLGLTGLVRRD